MAEKQRIILEAILKGKTQRRIAQEMKISRTTIARYLKEDEPLWLDTILTKIIILKK